MWQGWTCVWLGPECELSSSIRDGLHRTLSAAWCDAVSTWAQPTLPCHRYWSAVMGVGVSDGGSPCGEVGRDGLGGEGGLIDGS